MGLVFIPLGVSTLTCFAFGMIYWVLYLNNIQSVSFPTIPHLPLPRYCGDYLNSILMILTFYVLYLSTKCAIT